MRAKALYYAAMALMPFVLIGIMLLLGASPIAGTAPREGGGSKTRSFAGNLYGFFMSCRYGGAVSTKP